MNFRQFGKTGLRVSELCMGTMTLGREADEKESFRMLDRYVEAGGNFLDTANVYSAGASEEIIGKWLKGKRREDYVIASKVRFAMGKGWNDVGLTRKHILSAVQESLRRLHTDYIDLYQVHAWDPVTPLEETLSALNDLVHKGVVRYIGASNFRGWQLQKAIDLSKQNGWQSFVSIQPQYSLLVRATEYEIIPVSISEGLGVMPWSPLRGGWLSGKFRRGMTKPPQDSRVSIAGQKGWSETWEAYNNEHTWHVIDTLFEVAEEAGKTPAQTALNWVLNKPGVTSPIIGARNMEQLNDNLSAAGWSLTAEQMEKLDRASAMPVSYPYDESAEKQQRAGRL